jgi:hypothetical protein
MKLVRVVSLFGFAAIILITAAISPIVYKVMK